MSTMPKEANTTDEPPAETVTEPGINRLRLGLGVVWTVFIGEAAALYALADRPTAFLGALCIVSMSFVAFVLVDDFKERLLRDRPRSPERANDAAGDRLFEALVKTLVRDRPDWFFPIFIVAGAVLSSLFKFSQIHARPAFFSAAAGIYPVLLIAMFLEVKVAVARARQDIDSNRPKTDKVAATPDPTALAD